MKLSKILGMVAIAFMACSLCYAKDVSRTANISELKGTVEMKIAGGNWTTANLGAVLKEGDSIRTGKDSIAILNVEGMETATVEVKPDSQVKLAELIQDKEAKTQKTLLDLSLGEILIKVQKLHSPNSKFEVKTPTSIVGVRGTTFSVSVGTTQKN